MATALIVIGALVAYLWLVREEFRPQRCWESY